MLIEELSNLPGVSGNEKKVRDFIRARLQELDLEHELDSMGNLYARSSGVVQNGKEPGLMLSAHMDEVGLMVASVEKSGHLRFYTVGGVNPWSLVSRPVKIGGDEVPGVIGAKAVHQQKAEERTKALKVEQLYIDIGAKNKEDAEKKVQPGDYVSFAMRAQSMADGKMIAGKALDNRAGCAALLELLQRDFPVPFTAVFTVQEEVGLRGARVAAYRVNPRVALVLETTTASDLLDIEKKDFATTVGRGPAFTLRDGSVVSHPRVLERLIETAENLRRPYQFRQYTGSFTDAGIISLSRSGVMAGVISTPCRYIHTSASLLSKEDWWHLVEITDGFVRSVHEKGLEQP